MSEKPKKMKLKTLTSHLKMIDSSLDNKDSKSTNQKPQPTSAKTEEKKTNDLQKHLNSIKNKQKEQEAYNALTLKERRVYQALVDWCNKQQKISDGILELHFQGNQLIKENFEKITDSIDSTVKIQKMSGSAKLKEMLMALRRGSMNMLSEKPNKDIKENIYTFMFMKRKIQPHQRCKESANVIKHFKAFYES